MHNVYTCITTRMYVVICILLCSILVIEKQFTRQKTTPCLTTNFFFYKLHIMSASRSLNFTRQMM